jgi:hypothetical protein
MHDLYHLSLSLLKRSLSIKKHKEEEETKEEETQKLS